MPSGLFGYIIDVEDTGKSVRFSYYENIGNSIEPVYDDVAVRGRSEEHIFYSHTSAETYSFSIRLAASVDEADGGTTKKIWEDWLFIKSFAYPDYGRAARGPTKSPRKPRITIGTWFKEEGVIRSPQATFVPPYDEQGFPHIIDVQFTFRVVSSKPRGYSDIRAGAFSGRQ